MTSQKTDDTLNTFLGGLDPVTIGAIVGAVAVILTILLIFVRSRKPRRRTFILAGISDAGKTLLFSQLVFSKYIETYASIKENCGFFWVETKKKDAPLIDIPGNDRQRLQFWDRFKGQARGLIYVVDSSTIQKEVKEVAEYLYTILTDPGFPKARSYLLIACNKQDVTMAKSSRVVQSQLEKEINTLRVTRAASLDSTDSSAKTSEVFLGQKGKDFTFSQLSPMKVEFVECAAKGSNDSECDIKSVVDWINKVAK